MPISARELRECINKLKDGKDITKKEAVSIRARYGGRRQNLGAYYYREYYEFLDIYKNWFSIVLDRLPEFGNYVQTIPVKRYVFNPLGNDFIDIFFECMKKMTVIDRAIEVNFLSIPKDWNFNSNYFYFKWAGDLRFTKIYEKIKHMVPLFEGMSYFDFLTKSFERNWLSQCYFSSDNPNSNEEICLSLYVPTIISIARKMDMPVLNIEVDTINPDVSQGSRCCVIMANPEDREKLKSVLSVSPEEFFQKAMQTGLYETLKKDLLPPRIFYDKMGDFLIRYYFTKKKHEIIEDEEWMETER